MSCEVLSNETSKRTLETKEATDDEIPNKKFRGNLDEELEEDEEKMGFQSPPPTISHLASAGMLGPRRDKSPEKPAELFRKDLISAMKLADTEQLQQEDFFTITDPWRQDWERGVQVPVNRTAVKQPHFTVIEGNEDMHGPYAFKLPKKYLHALNDHSYRQGIHELHETDQMAEQVVRYDLDECDVAWLQLYNEEASSVGGAELSEWQMERVMEELETLCYSSMQEKIQTVEGLGIEYDENILCDVCRSPDSEDTNEMVFCDNCDICVHQACYGVQKIPSGSWLCRTCALGIRPRCVLCPRSGGAMKSTKSGSKWAHVSCALWIPEVTICCPDKMEPIAHISQIPSSRWSLICSVCRERSGACIQCCVKTCKTAFHVTCALNGGLDMKTILDERAEDVVLKGYCAKHTKKKEGEGSPRKSPVPVTRKENEMTEKEKLELRSHRLEMFGEEFNTCVKPEDVVKSLDLDPDAVDYVYAYWVLKRKSLFNKQLLMPKREEADILSKQREDSLIARMKMFIHLRQDLERVRNLCYMVGRREKVRRELYRLKEDIFHKQVSLSEDLSARDLSSVAGAHKLVASQSVYDQHQAILTTSFLLDGPLHKEETMERPRGPGRPRGARNTRGKNKTRGKEDGEEAGGSVKMEVSPGKSDDMSDVDVEETVDVVKFDDGEECGIKAEDGDGLDQPQSSPSIEESGSEVVERGLRSRVVKTSLAHRPRSPTTNAQTPTSDPRSPTAHGSPVPAAQSPLPSSPPPHAPLMSPAVKNLFPSDTNDALYDFGNFDEAKANDERPRRRCHSAYAASSSSEDISVGLPEPDSPVAEKPTSPRRTRLSLRSQTAQEPSSPEAPSTFAPGKSEPEVEWRLRAKGSLSPTSPSIQSVERWPSVEKSSFVEKALSADGNHGSFAQLGLSVDCDSRVLRSPTSDRSARTINSPGVERGPISHRSPVVDSSSRKLRSPGVERGPRNLGSPSIERGPHKLGSPGIGRSPRKLGSPGVERGPRKLSSPGIERSPRKLGSPGVEKGPRNLGSPGIERGPRNLGSPGIERGPRKLSSPGIERGPRNLGSPGVEKGSSSHRSPGVERGPSTHYSPGVDRGPSSHLSPAVDRGPPKLGSPGVERGPSSHQSPGVERDHSNHRSPGHRSPAVERGHSSPGVERGPGVHRSNGRRSSQRNLFNDIVAHNSLVVSKEIRAKVENSLKQKNCTKPRKNGLCDHAQKKIDAFFHHKTDRVSRSDESKILRSSPLWTNELKKSPLNKLKPAQLPERGTNHSRLETKDHKDSNSLSKSSRIPARNFPISPSSSVRSESVGTMSGDDSSLGSDSEYAASEAISEPTVRRRSTRIVRNIFPVDELSRDSTASSGKYSTRSKTSPLR